MTTDPIAALISTAALIGSILFINKLDNSTSLRPWTVVNSNAYVEIVNNTTFDLPVVVTASAVDNQIRFLGISKKCLTSRFKLPYVDTKVTVTVGVVSGEILVDKPKTYGIVINPDSSGGGKFQCQYITKQVWRIGLATSERAWMNSPWYRIDDPSGEWPWLIIQASDETICAVFDVKSSIQPPKAGDLYTCKTRWRIARR